MLVSNRFDSAIEKLYKAFHDGTLNPECCNHCAVGNICDNTDAWKHLTDIHGSTKLNYVGLVNENFDRRFQGYKPSELLGIEAAFLKGCGYSLPLTSKSRNAGDFSDRDTLFNGLCFAVAYLCQLEKIPNVMDCRAIFDFEPTYSQDSTHVVVA